MLEILVKNPKMIEVNIQIDSCLRSNYFLLSRILTIFFLCRIFISWFLCIDCFICISTLQPYISGIKRTIAFKKKKIIIIIIIGLRAFQDICQSWNSKYFDIKLFHATAIVLLIPEMYGCKVLIQIKQSIHRNHEIKILHKKKMVRIRDYYYFFFFKCLATKHFWNQKNNSCCMKQFDIKLTEFQLWQLYPGEWVSNCCLTPAQQFFS
jgi:hypothetical protein